MYRSLACTPPHHPCKCILTLTYPSMIGLCESEKLEMPSLPYQLTRILRKDMSGTAGYTKLVKYVTV